MRTLKLAAVAALALAVSTAFSQTGTAPKVVGGKTTVIAPTKETAPKDVSGAAGTTKTVPISPNPVDNLLNTPPSSTKSAVGGTTPAVTSTDTASTKASDSSPTSTVNWNYVALGGIVILALLYILYAVRKNNRQSSSGMQVNYGSAAPSAASSQAAGSTSTPNNIPPAASADAPTPSDTSDKGSS